MATTGTENINDPDPGTSNLLWKVLVIGLMGVIVISIIFVGVLLVWGIDSTVMVGFATAALTGLLGLFVTPKSSK